MAQTKEKIVICGHYGATNIGDEAIGLSLIQNLLKINENAEIKVLSYNAPETKKSFGVESAYLFPMGLRSLFRGLIKGELRKTLKVIKECDKFILGGGGLFTDEKIFAVFLWGIHVFLACRYRKPVYMVGQSIGPLRTRIGRWITKKCFSKAKLICVRDTESKKLLEKLNIKNKIFIAPDLAFGLNITGENLNNNFDQKGCKGYFLISLRPWLKNSKILYKKIAQEAALISEKYSLLPIFIPFQQAGQNDAELMRKILDQSNPENAFLIQKFTQNFVDIKSLIINAEFLIGMRLHSLIFAIKFGVPFVGIDYSPKVKNLISDAGLSENLIKMDEADSLEKSVSHILKHKEAIKNKEKEFTLNSEIKIREILAKI